MEYQDAQRLANKIKRALESTPSDVRVIITSSTVEICDKEEMDRYEEQFGHLDNVPHITCVTLRGRDKVIGFEGKL